MWTCGKCGRIFKKNNQPHTCQKIVLEEHFRNKKIAKDLFNRLVTITNSKIGKCQIISLPCCIHLFGEYDFLAVLPKKDRLEIRFTLNRKIECAKLKQSVPVSKKGFKHCMDIKTIEEINIKLVKWLNESYHLKNF
jgi:hypothetical protein